MNSQSQRLNKLEERQHSIDSELERIRQFLKQWEENCRVVRVAHGTWKPFLAEAGHLIFRNGTNEIGRLPTPLVRLIAEGRPFAGEVRDAGEAVEFWRGGVQIAQAPKSLVLQLRGLLEQHGGFLKARASPRQGDGP